MDDTDMDDTGMRGASRSTLLAVEDTEFLLRDEMRAIRFALEYSKAELALRDWGIRSTIIVFGSARIPSPEQAAAAVEAAQTDDERKLAEQWQQRSELYRTAREFGRIASQRGGAFAPRNRWRDNVIATGGGPGIMEAANRGAADVGAPSVGFNITLPHEQVPNLYVTPELSFRFHYFAMRKMHLAMRANALAIFPGGFGTMDELFEVLTLQQTGKAPPAPIVLFGEAYWRRIVNFEALVDEGMISPADLHLVEFAETAEEGWASLIRRGLRIDGDGAAGRPSA
ncbi:MAG TPA: LOG family protein [Pseudolabrys sp.]|nr:LOG family protein [Pseudolabrys sp.]